MKKKEKKMMIMMMVVVVAMARMGIEKQRLEGLATGVGVESSCCTSLER